MPEEDEYPLIGAYVPPISARVEAPPSPEWPEARPYEPPTPRPYEPPTPRPYESWTPPEPVPAPEFIPASSTFDLPSFDEGDGQLLSQRDSELLISFLTAPYLRLPLVLTFFAVHIASARVFVALEGWSMQVAFYHCVRAALDPTTSGPRCQRWQLSIPRPPGHAANSNLARSIAHRIGTCQMW